jgi:hypothetical protein
MTDIISRFTRAKSKMSCDISHFARVILGFARLRSGIASVMRLGTWLKRQMSPVNLLFGRVKLQMSRAISHFAHAKCEMTCAILQIAHVICNFTRAI